MTFAFEADPTACSGALRRLSAIGFDEAGVRERLALNDINDLTLKALPIYRRERLQQRDALALSIELFVLQGSLTTSELDSVFGRTDQDALLHAGVLRRKGGTVRAQVSLYPVGRRLMFSDHAWPQLDEGGRSTVSYNHVMYVGTDSRWLARATVRRPFHAALDLCCGSGVQALLAASHADTATAVDINHRAIACTAFNAQVLGLSNLQALHGDLYAPVAERKFDLITANPPFVPAPSQEVGFRDGGPTGEDVQRRIVEGLPRHLANGGVAQIVTELGEREGEPLERRLRQWLGGAPMDIHILRLRVHTAQAYAIGHARGDDAVSMLDSVDRWAANLSAQGYHQVASVLLAFQWSDAPWTREDHVDPPKRDAGEEVEAIFAAEHLSREPGLRDRLTLGSVARTGPVALVETQALGTRVPAALRACMVGLAMPLEHGLDPVERDILTSMAHPVTTSDLLAVAARASVSEDIVLDAMVSLVRKGIIRPRPS
jgi:methylase of polypeptide subunit release factors